MDRELYKECLCCGRFEQGTLFVTQHFCSASCRAIWFLRRRLGLRVRKGL
jgi:hypothetical protein